MCSERRTRRDGIAPLLLGLALGLALVAALWYLPLDSYILRAGPAADAHRLVQLPGGKPGTGRILVPTVLSRRANVLAYVSARFNPHVQLLAAAEFLGDFPDQQALEQGNTEMMAGSVAISVVSALAATGQATECRPAGVKVVALAAHRSAEGNLVIGDWVHRVDGRPLADGDELRRIVAARPVGSRILLQVQRAGEQVPVTITVPPPDPAYPLLVLDFIPTDHFDCQIPAGLSRPAEAGLLGPSAGLAMAVAAAEQATGADITAGRVVAATGVVNIRGEVLPVGMVAQKARSAAAAGAEILLVPAGQGEAARAAGTRLEVIEVHAVSAALVALGYGTRVNETDSPPGTAN